MEAPQGAGAAYTADRAAALAGIPRSTLHYWARTGIWTPSVSTTRVKRWSFSDLLALRLIDWLRQEKPDARLPRTSMTRIRGALATMDQWGDRLSDHAVRVWVDPRGRLIIESGGEVFIPLSRGLAQGLGQLEGLDLVEAREASDGQLGPHLLRPRPTLRIVLGKLSGEPHVADTRIPTTSLAALADRGLTVATILDLYPQLRSESVVDAIDLERQLASNLGAAA